MEPTARHPVDLALRAVYEALASLDRPATAWRRLAASLMLHTGADGLIARSRLEEIVRSMRPGMATAQLLAAAERLGVLAGRGDRIAYSPAAAEDVARALELAGSSLSGGSRPSSWTPVGTIPELLRRNVVVPELRQTAGVLLEIIDHARRELWLTAPFVERGGIAFLKEALLGALERGVLVRFVVRRGTLEGGGLSEFMQLIGAVDGLRVIEVATPASELGSHAKVCLADDEVCYIGSANLTSHGLGRHLELGARLQGPDVAIIRAALEAIVHLGTQVYPPSPIRND